MVFVHQNLRSEKSHRKLSGKPLSNMSSIISLLANHPLFLPIAFQDYVIIGKKSSHFARYFYMTFWTLWLAIFFHLAFVWLKAPKGKPGKPDLPELEVQKGSKKCLKSNHRIRPIFCVWK